MTPDELSAAPCKGKTPFFVLPTADDPNPAYNEARAKGLCALCPPATFRACYAEGDGERFLIRAGLTPDERAHGTHNRRPLTDACGRCGSVDWFLDNGSRRCAPCKRNKDRKRYDARRSR